MNKLIWTEDELRLLFPNQIQRDIFIKGINSIVEIIVERTVTTPFVQLECI